jgi:hypothetical protein
MARKGSRRYSRKQKGGDSGWQYGLKVNGLPNAQFSRTFDATGPYADRVGSEYIGAQGQWFKQPNTPSAENLNLIQSAGRRRKRGGFLGPIISQAIVPFSLLGLQQTYRRKKHGGRKTRRHSRRHH